MKKLLLLFIIAACATAAHAIDNDNVEIVYNGTTATVTVADNIANVVTVTSGTSSHVVITSTTESVEISYALKGTSDDGSFTLDGSYKCEIDLNGLTLTNPSGPALNIQNGKRVAISAKKSTTNTLADGSNKDFNGCIHCTGHLEFKGKGTLNVVGNAKHAIYSKEYTSIKNLTLNITSAKKDGIHCGEYFLMEDSDAKVTISNTGDDGIQCELVGETSTGKIDGHEDEDTGNVYLDGGTLTIKDCGGKTIKTDGEIIVTGGTQNFDIPTAITTVKSRIVDNAAIYDLSGRRVITPARGLYIQNGKKFIKR